MKRYLGIPLKIIIGLAVIFAGYFAGLSVYYYLNQWYFGYAIDTVEKQYVKQLAEDIAGGETPEETWAMFIFALEKGDIEQASQYFYLETREDERKSLQYHKTAGTLANFVAGLKDDYAKSSREPGISDNELIYKYKFFQDAGTSKVLYPDGSEEIKDFPAGEYEGQIHFVKNEVTNIWKIYRL